MGTNIQLIVGWDQWGDEFPDGERYISQEISRFNRLGRKITEEVVLIPCEGDGVAGAFYLMIRDITEIRSLEESYRAKSEILHLIESNSSDIIAVIDDRGIVRYVSSSYTVIFDRHKSEVVNRNALDYIHPDDLHFVQQRLEESLKGEIYWLPVEFRYLHNNGEWIYLDVRATPVETQNGIGQVTLFLRDISQRKGHEELIHHIAYYDSLTDLPNRHFLYERLEQLLSAHPERLGLLFIDLDGFKQVNDTQGHSAGDQLLQQVSRRLARHLPVNGFLARMGGDEFIVLLDALTNFKQFAQMTLHLFEEPFFIEGRNNSLSTSIGISVYPFHGTSAEELVRTADIALYQAKEKGKNRYSCYESN